MIQQNRDFAWGHTYWRNGISCIRDDIPGNRNDRTIHRHFLQLHTATLNSAGLYAHVAANEPAHHILQKTKHRILSSHQCFCTTSTHFLSRADHAALKQDDPMFFLRQQPLRNERHNQIRMFERSMQYHSDHLHRLWWTWIYHHLGHSGACLSDNYQLLQLRHRCYLINTHSMSCR